MKKIVLKYRIIFMFLIPNIVFLYFSYKYIQNEYKVQEEALEYKYSISVINQLSDLIHNMQLERGLSAGYLVKNNRQIKKKLKEQYLSSDSMIQVLSTLFQNKQFKYYIESKNKRLLLDTLSSLHKIKILRNRVLNLSLDFKEQVKYYTDINTNLILCIKYINFNFIHTHKDANTIGQIELLKEYSGLERAYVYNQILSQNKNGDYLKNIQLLKQKQERTMKELLFNASKQSSEIYKTMYLLSLKNQIDNCTKNLIQNRVVEVDAEQCFRIYTKYINIFNKINKKLLEQYKIETDEIYKNSLNSLYVTLTIWIFLILLIIFIIYILIKMINKEERSKLDLKIAAFTFDAYAGVVITDPEGIILKINDSFTKITGYSEEEAIGDNPRILKSDKHQDKFYVKMWDDLIEKGTWQGDIFNKRKNGEVYLETLSIKAIKNEKNVITHYIAQFVDVSEMRKVQKELQNKVQYDMLTSLFNREALVGRLLEEFSKAMRHDFLHAFLFIDIDDFKSVNDTYGHNIGDKLLVEIAKRLKSVVREGDIVARISGDKFGVVLLNIAINKSEAQVAIAHACKKILYEISKDFILENEKFNNSVSIGAKIFPDHDENVKHVMIDADKAMYKSKKSGKNKFIIFNTKELL